MSTWKVRPDGGRPEGRRCAHLDRADPAPRTRSGCQECEADGGHWTHLLLCLDCGHLGCCDSSPGRHATAHYEATGHPVARSAERRADWAWCYVDEVYLRPAGDPDPDPGRDSARCE
ncbi:UBP-type zinc finger domain-containing protein [Streptomyces sp. NPDC059582]|uniref:UBP-type zinc finger domain-containing protein n=1 Tax=Streptomyces sp. NPDC059582 TaxID=3346875 RepID=UPI003699FE4D